MSTVVDYAFSHPPLSAVRGAGIHCVGRYVSENPANDHNGKNLIPSENSALRGAGISVVLFAEEGATDLLGGHGAGVQRAQHFNAVVKALGRPDAVMMCTADFDAAPGQQAAINAYLDGAASVIGRERTGLYGGYYPVARALNAGKCAHAVQTFAWSRFSSAGAFNAAEFAESGAEPLRNAVGNPYTYETQFDQEPTHSAPADADLAAAGLPSNAVLVTKVAGRTLPNTFLYDKRAGLRQGLIGNLGGGSVDFDESVMADFGQHPRPKGDPKPAPGPTWNWYTTDGNQSLAGVLRALNPQLPASTQMRPAQVLRMTVEKNNGSWDPPGGDGILGDWVNLVLGDPETSSHTAIGKGAKLWVLRP